MRRLGALAVVAATLVACGGGGAEVDRSGVVGADDVPTESAHGPDTVTIYTSPVNKHTGVYAPAELTVAAGTEVTFHNDDGQQHNVIHGQPGSKAGDFNSGLFRGGESWSLTLDEPGTYPYWCSLHPDMTGVLTVT